MLESQEMGVLFTAGNWRGASVVNKQHVTRRLFKEPVIRDYWQLQVRIGKYSHIANSESDITTYAFDFETCEQAYEALARFDSALCRLRDLENQGDPR